MDPLGFRTCSVGSIVGKTEIGIRSGHDRDPRLSPECPLALLDRRCIAVECEYDFFAEAETEVDGEREKQDEKQRNTDMINPCVMLTRVVTLVVAPLEVLLGSLVTLVVDKR